MPLPIWLAVTIGVTGIARSGKGAELMAWAGIDAAGITAAAKAML